MNANLRLAYRIASMPATPPHPSMRVPVNESSLMDRMKCEAEMVKKSPLLNLDQVAQFYARHEKQVWTCEDDIPNWTPPFPMFFVEWNEPSIWKMPFGSTMQNREGQIGYLVMTFPIPNDMRADVTGWNRLMGQVIGQAEPARIDEDKLRHCLARSQWMLFLSSWSAVDFEGISGKPLYTGTQYFLFVAHNGRLVDRIATGICIESLRELGGDEGIWSPINIFGMGMTFFHSKTTHPVEVRVSNGKDWHSRNSVPILNFHTVCVDPSITF